MNFSLNMIDKYKNEECKKHEKKTKKTKQAFIGVLP